MIIELGVVAAAAAIGGMFAARARRKQREAALAATTALEAADEKAEPEPDVFAQLPAGIGDVIQAGDTTRWPRDALLVRADGELLCAVLLSEEDGERQATIAMTPPNRNLYWLLERDTELPDKPPARLEVDGLLLDRQKLVTVELERVGDGAPEIGDSGQFALYHGTVSDAAVVLVGAMRRVWYGQRLAPEDYDRLGRGDSD